LADICHPILVIGISPYRRHTMQLCVYAVVTTVHSSTVCSWASHMYTRACAHTHNPDTIGTTFLLFQHMNDSFRVLRYKNSTTTAC